MNIFKILFLTFTLLGCNACEQSATLMNPGYTTPPQAGEDVKQGGVDGGGGNAIVCRNEAGEIESAEVLDLFEGTSMYALNIQKTNEPMDQQIDRALSKFPANARLAFAAFTGIVQDKMQILPLGTKLESVNDSFQVVLPTKCQVEQAARYYSQERILFNGEIWAKLGETDRAALILHEGIYAVNRAAGASDSRRSRHIVAQLFDPTTRWQEWLQDVPEDALSCFAVNGKLGMTAHKLTSNSWILNFSMVGSALVVSQTTAMIPGISNGFDFKEASLAYVEKGEDKIGTSLRVTTTLDSKFEDQDIVVIERKWEALADSSGKTVRGLQAPRYYLTWTSGSFPGLKSGKLLLNCSLKK